MSRFTRQVRLADVGEVGQAKLSAATVGLATSGAARDIEATYLRAAGVTVDEAAPARGVANAAGAALAGAELGLRHAAARDVADGAYAALVAIREIVDG